MGSSASPKNSLDWVCSLSRQQSSLQSPMLPVCTAAVLAQPSVPTSCASFAPTACAVSSPGEPTNWAVNIANIFLAPFGLGSSDSSVSAEGTQGDVLKQTQRRLPRAMPVHVACRDDRWEVLLQQSNSGCKVEAFARRSCAHCTPHHNIGRQPASHPSAAKRYQQFWKAASSDTCHRAPAYCGLLCGCHADPTPSPSPL